MKYFTGTSPENVIVNQNKRVASRDLASNVTCE